jgi:hypothetical protein
MLCLLCSKSTWIAKKNKGRSMPFALPMIWRKPTDHMTDCYFCIYIFATSARNHEEKTWAVTYPNILPAIWPVPHTEDIPVPLPPRQYILDSDEEPSENWEKTPQPSTSTDADFTAELQFNKFNRITQHELNDLIRNLDLEKSKTELLGSRLQHWNLLEENIRLYVYLNL